jgi:hypothetical protein
LGHSGARGTLIYEKNLKPKISCQTPFNKVLSNEPNFGRIHLAGTVPLMTPQITIFYVLSYLCSDQGADALLLL